MIEQRPAVAVTGAYGYLGALTCAALESKGAKVVRLVRSPRRDDPTARRYQLSDPVAPGLLDGVDVLVHAAYDFGLTRPADIWRVNVEGTRRLLGAAREAGVERVIVLSTMSAYQGTTQLYGRAKLAIEEATASIGGCSVRPGLVYGDNPGGMAGALRKMTRLPVVPLVAGQARQYPVHEDDLIAALVALVTAPELPRGPIGVAQANPLSFRALLEAFAAQEGRRCRFVPVPWQLLYWPMRLVELLPVTLAFRSDSLLGLVRPAPSVPGRRELSELGVQLRAFDLATA